MDNRQNYGACYCQDRWCGARDLNDCVSAPARTGKAIRRVPPGYVFVTEDDVALLRSLSELGEVGLVKREYMAGRHLDLSASLAFLADRLARMLTPAPTPLAPSPETAPLLEPRDDVTD